MREVIPLKQHQVQTLRKEHGEFTLGSYNIGQAYGGMRGIIGLVYETSLLDPQEGIRFRGLSIPECQEKLPKAKGGNEPLPEALLYLLFTGEVPTEAQTADITRELGARSAVPQHVKDMLDNFPKHVHPMSQLSAAVTALNTESQFVKAYNDGVNKKLYWEYAFEDSLNCIAKLPSIAARIYRNTYKDKKKHPSMIQN